MTTTQDCINLKLGDSIQLPSIFAGVTGTTLTTPTRLSYVALKGGDRIYKLTFVGISLGTYCIVDNELIGVGN